MKLVKIPIKRKERILALGAESAGVFAVYKNGGIFVSENFGDLLAENNFLKYKKAVLEHFKKEKNKPDVILTDLHPLYRTTIFGEELARKYQILQIKVQHHLAHIFSAVGDRIINAKRWNFNFNHSTFNVQRSAFFGVAMDGTGYGFDGNIWGGEIFKISNDKFTLLNCFAPPAGGFNRVKMTNQCQNSKSKMKIRRNGLRIERTGSLEEQTMIGGDLAVREPARMLIAILAKITNYKLQITNKQQNTKLITQKDDIYKFVKKFYARNEFEVLYSQLKQNFNCQKTTSTGRVLDAVSVLLGFAGNERKYKHEAVKLLEENSGKPYDDIGPRIMNQESRKILSTIYLFEYLIKNINRDKKRLAATAQLYLAMGFYEMIKKLQTKDYRLPTIFTGGGLSNNKIISSYLESRGVYLSKKISRGDEGIAFGQIVHYLLNKF